MSDAWIEENWDGVMIEYTEQDFPTSQPYQRRIPGWQCKRCGFQYGTSGAPPRECWKCPDKQDDPHG